MVELNKRWRFDHFLVHEELRTTLQVEKPQPHVHR